VHVESKLGNFVLQVDPTGTILHRFFDHGDPPPGERFDVIGIGKVQAIPPSLMESASRGELTTGRLILLDHAVAAVR
jgi:hypothetical protein